MKKTLVSIICAILVAAMLPIAAFAGTVTKKLTMELGSEYSFDVSYSELGLEQSSVEFFESNLTDYGLAGFQTDTALRIIGTPANTGTAYFSVKDGNGDIGRVEVAVRSGVIEKTETLDVKVGSTVNKTYTYAQLGFESGCTPSADSSANTLASFGLNATFTGTQLTISGTPSKVGTASFTLILSKNGADHSLTVTVNIAADSITKSVNYNAAVGESFSKTITFSEQGFSGITSVVNDSIKNTLGDFGLSYSYTNSYFNVFGTPTKPGTATFRQIIKIGNVDNYIDINILITATPTAKEATVTAVVGENMSKTLKFSDYDLDMSGFTISGDLDENTLGQYGLSMVYTAAQCTIVGTPTQTGTAKARIIGTKNGEKKQLDINVVIAGAAEGKSEVFNAVKGEAFSKTVVFADYGFTGGSINADSTYNTLAEYGLSASWTASELKITGTPSKTGTARFRQIITNDGADNTLDIYVSITASTTPGGTTDPQDKYLFPFVDVFESDWYYGDVYSANKMGLIDGRTKTLYKPADNMTYAEAIKLAACMHQYCNEGKVTLQNGTPNWYNSYVRYASRNGIPWDYNNYNAKITREDFVHIFFSALPKDNYVAINTVTKIPDITSGSNKYYSEILSFYKAGILTGSDSKGTFHPKSNIKRSEVAAIISRMMEPSARRSFKIW